MIKRGNKDTVGRQITTFLFWLGIPLISNIRLPFLILFSESLKYATVVTLEYIYCNAGNKKSQSTLDVVHEMFSQHALA